MDHFTLTAHTHQKPDIIPPNFSAVQVTDTFQRLVRLKGRRWLVKTTHSYFTRSMCYRDPYQCFLPELVGVQCV